MPGSNSRPNVSEGYEVPLIEWELATHSILANRFSKCTFLCSTLSWGVYGCGYYIVPAVRSCAERPRPAALLPVQRPFSKRIRCLVPEDSKVKVTERKVKPLLGQCTRWCCQEMPRSSVRELRGCVRVYTIATPPARRLFRPSEQLNVIHYFLNRDGPGSLRLCQRSNIDLLSQLFFGLDPVRAAQCSPDFTLNRDGPVTSLISTMEHPTFS